MSESFKSTREIWEWLLEKPEVNQVVNNICGEKRYLTRDGSMNVGEMFGTPCIWSKRVELPKVTIDYETLKKAMEFSTSYPSKNYIDAVALQLGLL